MYRISVIKLGSSVITMFTPTGRPSWCLLICILVAVKTVVTNSDFCNVTRSTKKVVPTCPDSLDKWNEASKRKNCTQYASQCSEPEKLEYHCVINPFINETLEVCAYGQYIISGHCTEYSSTGNLIQPNRNTNCLKFSSKPCHIPYKSTEAYKYPGCYDLITKTTVTEQTEAEPNPKFTTVAPCSSSPQIHNEIGHENNAERFGDVLIPSLVTVFVLLLSTLGLLFLLVLYLKKKPSRSQGYKYRDKDFKENFNEVLPLTNVEHENGNYEIAPSGQQINRGNDRKKTVEVEEDEIPDIHLKEDEDPIQECQRWVQVVNDTLEKLVFIQHEHGHNKALLLDERFDNPAFLSDESSEKIREESQYLKSYETQMINYFKRGSDVKKED
ncbi:uncharacterized protein LOC128168734 [Crassostrea angulata]|uniref:uncharacterized protein LOC128168734 n=1 Tax=Magallana angulata TaxID=2784310 RepID=UPI0022B0C1CE|nr:uncharacterized protein LOC128168734 [Crassostrea angulata]